MNLSWILVIGGGLVAGVMTPPVWKVALAFLGLALFFAACSLGWAILENFALKSVLALEAGQISQLVVGVYLCAIASAVTALRAAFRGKHAT